MLSISDRDNPGMESCKMPIFSSKERSMPWNVLELIKEINLQSEKQRFVTYARQ